MTTFEFAYIVVTSYKKALVHWEFLLGTCPSIKIDFFFLLLRLLYWRLKQEEVNLKEQESGEYEIPIFKIIIFDGLSRLFSVSDCSKLLLHRLMMTEIDCRDLPFPYRVET